MKRSFLSISLLGLSLLGCQSASSSTSRGGGGIAADVSPNQVGAPDLNARTAIALYLWDRELRVGDSSDDAKIFPNRERVIESSDKPAKFGDRYRTRIWESEGEGFGVILYEGRVAAALAHSVNATQDRIRDVVRTHEDRISSIKPTFVNGENTNYWFWEEDSQRLMICALRMGDSYTMTVAMGDVVVLDAIGASPETAANAAKKVDEILQSQNSEEIP